MGDGSLFGGRWGQEPQVPASSHERAPSRAQEQLLWGMRSPALCFCPLNLHSTLRSTCPLPQVRKQAQRSEQDLPEGRKAWGAMQTLLSKVLQVPAPNSGPSLVPPSSSFRALLPLLLPSYILHPEPPPRLRSCPGLSSVSALLNGFSIGILFFVPLIPKGDLPKRF